MTHKGTFIMIDGLDGSGKGVVATAIKDYCKSKGKKVFDLREYWEVHDDIPEIVQIRDYDVIISSEPTFAWVGKALRREVCKINDRTYSALTTAMAFSLDREILYKKLILPAIKEGKIIIQERGVITSLVYQPVQLERLSLKDIMDLPGNKLAIQNAPTVMVITQVDPNVVVYRLKHREKQDDAIFEKLDFQKKIAERYSSDWLKQLFEKFGSKVVYLDTNYPKIEEDTKKAAVEMFKEYVKFDDVNKEMQRHIL